MAIRKLLFASSVLALLSACASTVVVKSDVPPPLVDSVPLSASLEFTEKFRNYSYTESKKRRSPVTGFDLAAAQQDMFSTVFDGLVTLVPSGDSSADLSITPEILDFQYSTPKETRQNHYEVWLKYRLRLEDKNADGIADWVIKGYGKTPTATLQSPAKAFAAAANVALRDVGAQLAVRFPQQSSIQAMLNKTASNDGASALASNTEESQPDETLLAKQEETTDTDLEVQAEGAAEDE